MTVKKFHVNPETGAHGRCSAGIRECLYSNGNEENHYSSEVEAISAGELIMEKIYGSISTNKKVENFDKKALSLKLEEFTQEELEDFVNSSRRNYSQVEELMLDRCKETPMMHVSLQALNPYNKEIKFPASKEVWKMVVDEHDQYRNETAELVESLTASRFFKPSYRKLNNLKNLGKAVKVADLEPSSVEWLKGRQDSVGGSDVGLLVEKDFIPESEQPFYLEQRYQNIVNTKTVPNDNPVPLESSAMRRGQIWEARIRDDFAKDNPQLKVYDVKSQFVHPERPWQKINVDGVLSSREDGKPDGILEVKTSSRPEDWENGIPLGYRAQVLYYLNTTGFSYARVRALINDHEVKDYYINRDEPIAEGGKINMETYIQKRITPWFEDLQSKKKANVGVGV